MSARTYIIVILLSLAQACRAQETDTVYNFMRASRVIFEDGPYTDAEGSLPANWLEVSPVNVGMVTMDGDVPVLRYAAGKGMFAKARISDSAIAGNYTTFECDVWLEDSTLGKFTVGFHADDYRQDRHYSLQYNWLPEVWFPYDPATYIAAHNFMTPISEVFGRNVFHYNEWHHIAICFMATGSITYVDGRQITNGMRRQATRADAKHKDGFMPRQFSLGGLPTYMVKNVVFATSETVPTLTPSVRRKRNDFNAINTERKLVTHAIHFDVDESVIKPESIAFVADLAKWLKEHPEVRLEIDGHTDSDGDATVNMKLSKARADEVRKQLVANGIAETRLTTKGYGATKPLQPNTTEAGKADNRRVEFVKQ